MGAGASSIISTGVCAATSTGAGAARAAGVPVKSAGGRGCIASRSRRGAAGEAIGVGASSARRGRWSTTIVSGSSECGRGTFAPAAEKREILVMTRAACKGLTAPKRAMPSLGATSRQNSWPGEPMT